MGRPRKFQEQDVIASASHTFSTQGYGATTMDDLVRATGLGRQSLYNTFEGKRELFLRALTADTDEAIAAADEALGSDNTSPLERIRVHLVKLAIAFSSGHGSGALFTRATVELAHRDDAVASSAMQAFARLRGIYHTCLSEAQESGELGAEVDLDALASFFLALTRGMEVIGNAGVGRAELTSIAMTALDGVIAQNLTEGIVSSA